VSWPKTGKVCCSKESGALHGALEAMEQGAGGRDEGACSVFNSARRHSFPEREKKESVRLMGLIIRYGSVVEFRSRAGR